MNKITRVNRNQFSKFFFSSKRCMKLWVRALRRCLGVVFSLIRHVWVWRSFPFFICIDCADFKDEINGNEFVALYANGTMHIVTSFRFRFSIIVPSSKSWKILIKPSNPHIRMFLITLPKVWRIIVLYRFPRSWLFHCSFTAIWHQFFRTNSTGKKSITKSMKWECAQSVIG